MSGPFRFNQEEARSPLDRSASPFSSGQPVSFKTNVNRAKTKKWVQAKKNAYDGDDWGEYDEYDEYGVNQEPDQAQAQTPAQRYYAQRTEHPSRSFTDPSQQAPLPRARRNSFEHGEEQRAFSSTIPSAQPGHGPLHVETQGHAGSSAVTQGRHADAQSDFSPSALPPPLQTRISQVPVDFTATSNAQFPPRKSSIGARASPIATSPSSRKGSQTDKPLPFIRPADIYKRHQEEQARASLESGRPSIDSLSSPLPHDVASTREDGKSLQPMETVAERKSEYLPNFDATSLPADNQSLQSPDDERLRSVVDQAFTRADELRSVPPTPISNDSGSDLLRSNTGSTSGISPIMSRVPSSATSALKARNQADGSTPAIAEEPAEAATPVTQPTSAIAIESMHRFPRKPSPGHSRNLSSSSNPRSGLATPTPGDSPARSPVLTPSKDIPEPVSALITTESHDSSEAMEGGLPGPSAAYAAREADIATAVRTGSDAGASQLGVAERQSQNTFLDSHNAQSPIEDALPRDRSESPSKGRVQALAGRFGEVASSRRGSTQSIHSRNSVQSWERSHDNSRSASPTKINHSKPSSPVKEFRPHLPGQWESYATTAMTPSEHGEQDRGLNRSSNDLASLDIPDLTPTTPKQPLTGTTTTEADTSNPIAALKDAGAAMANSIRATLGAEENSSDSQPKQKRRIDHGNMFLPRPLSYRTLNSSPSAPPTPPAKDTTESEFPPPAPLKDGLSQGLKSQPQRPTLDPQLSTETSNEDEESDRLRKEIVASLSPFGMSESLAHEPKRTSLQTASPDKNRASSILPSEYDTYWASEDRASRQSFQDVERNAQDDSKAATVSFLPQSDDPTKPVITSRFSWEASNPRLQTPDEQARNASEEEPTKASHEIERTSEKETEAHSEGLSDSCLGPEHALAIVKPNPIVEADRPETSPPVDPVPVASSPTREHTHSPSLHVVNTEFNPEAVDIPPRLSADDRQPEESSLAEKQEPEVAAQQPAEALFEEAPKTPIITQEVSAKSPTTDKPLGAREIATLNSASERIETYNRTREYWATADHGLGCWLASTLEAHPELVTQTYPVQRMPTSSIRHRHTGSLLFGKLAGSGSTDVGTEQHVNASTPVPAGASSPAAAAPSNSGFGGRITNQQMQLKGKDLLHTANVLSGKGMTSAKGFFAKGKSRFGREKVTSHTRTESAPATRNVSEEAELVVRRSRASPGLAATLMRSVTQKGTKSAGASGEKKKRRLSFSSQFRRASRSRSRPSSIALANNASSPHELHQSHRFLKGDEGGNSFCDAPDSWDKAPGVPPTASSSYFSATTPPRLDSGESRLGILPSPAKSAFSNPDKDTEQRVPPVPAIPYEEAIRHYRRRCSQEEGASHELLQSVIRYATPQSMSSRPSTPPRFDTQSGAQEKYARIERIERIQDNGGFHFGFVDDEAADKLERDGSTLPTTGIIGQPGPAGGSVAADSGTSHTRRVSASPMHMHAVGGEASSSVASWNHAEMAVQSRVGDDGSFVAPFAQLPRIVQSSPGPPKATESHVDNVSHAMSNGHFPHQGDVPDWKLQAQQLQQLHAPSGAVMPAPERPRSILSQISAMVSDEGSAPYSQASTGRSTPSTIRRMQPESSVKPSPAPAQIPEEGPTWHNHHALTSQVDDYDLYADHNGVVKDVRDESGQPLRIAPSHPPRAAEQHRVKSDTPNTVTTPEPRDEERPRFSFERPMSFISGPADQDGKPQDQINRSNDVQVPSIAEERPSHVHHAYSPQADTVYCSHPPTHMDPLPNHSIPAHKSSSPGASPPKNILRAVKSIDPINNTIHPNLSRPPGEPSSQLGPSERHDTKDRIQQNGKASNRTWHNALGRRTVLGQQVPQGSMDYAQRDTLSNIQDSRHEQALGSQYESRQQVMQQQKQHPSSWAASSQIPTQEILQPQDRPSSKPGLSSMFKSLGVKAQASSDYHPSSSSTTANSYIRPLPTASSSNQSAANGFSRHGQDSVHRPMEQPRSFVPPNRPGMVQQSSSNGIQPQQPTVTSNIDAHPHQPPKLGAPESSRKRRFSGLGALFGRGVAAGDGLTTRFKLTKEDKKAQKAPRSSPAPPALTPVSQWVPQQQPHKPQQSGLAYYPPGQLPPHTIHNVQPKGPGYASSQSTQDQYSQRSLQQQQQKQPPRQSIASVRLEEGSAFLTTKQLAEEYQARRKSLQSSQANSPNSYGRQSSSASHSHLPPDLPSVCYGTPLEGYYEPDANKASDDQGAYAASLEARQQVENFRQHRSSRQQDIYLESQSDPLQTTHLRQPSKHGQSVDGESRYMQHQTQQHPQQTSTDYSVHQARSAQQQKTELQQGQRAYEHGEVPLDGGFQNQHHQLRQDHMQRRHPSGPSSRDSSENGVPVSPPANLPIEEPKYEAPPIPAAYNHVSGAFVSPLDRPYIPQHDLGMHVSRDEFGRQHSDPRMSAISPQVSAQSHPPNHRTHSDASTVSVISPISNSPGMPTSPPVPGGQRSQKPRMSSISEVHHQDRPWHLNFPVGTTEQDIVRARQDQYMQARFTAQQQQQAERAAGSPSPRPLTPRSAPPHVQVHGGGFREVLPRSSSQTRVPSPSLHGESLTVHRIATPVQPTPIPPGKSLQSTEYPLPMSPDPSDVVGSVNLNTNRLPPPPPPKIPHSPMGLTFPNKISPSIGGQQHVYNHSLPDHEYISSHRNMPQYEEHVPEEAPPSYDGPGVPNDGLDKNRPEAPRPPNIRTDMNVETRRQSDFRQRQASIGILQHPQPASMAASPQRTEADMGADSLRLQLSRQENLMHMERAQREQQQREVRQRERREREAARARARELERSVSGGGQVGSLRSVGGSTNGGAPGWERRGSHSRPVFELPAEDDEPTMKATSYPGQEWVPPMWDVD